MATIPGPAMSDTTLGADGASLVDVGDGVQVVNSMRGLALDGLDLVDNERVGLLLHMVSDDLSTATMTGITVEGSVEMLGAIAQGTAVPSGWDTSVARTGATIDNDLAFAGVLDIVAVVAPTDLPLSGAAGAFNLDAVVAPTD